MALHRHPRGTTLIEAMIALTIMLIGLLGLASLQTLVVRSNHFGKRLAQASAMAMDLEGNIRRWDYADGRLTPTGMSTVTTFDHTAITNRWTMGRSTTSAFTAHFSDQAVDTNASNAGALTLNGSVYQGLTSAMNGTQPEFIRYWNVVAVDLTNSGTPNGKLVQIIVRWKEPFFGYRQITSSAFKLNPASALQ